MTKVEEAQEVLKALGMPPAQQNEMSALTLLALCGLRARDPWNRASRRRATVTKGIMEFVGGEHGRVYAPNTRETFRRQVLHQFVQARIADYNPFEPDLPTNSPRAHYALTEAALAAIRTYGTKRWKRAVAEFIHQHGALLTAYERKRARRLVPVRLPEGRSISLSPGKHNELEAAILQEFAPRFCPGAAVMYIGDTAKKTVCADEHGLTDLGIPLSDDDKLPDVILYQRSQKWLFLIEAVTSHGPMTPKRVQELSEVLVTSKVRPIYVTAFPSLVEFRTHLRTIAWETEVWIAEIPDHMIHFNGERFLGPP